jgi:hypothetical protein
VFENRVVGKIFGPKRKITGGWRKLHNEELHNLYSSPNIITMIKSRTMKEWGMCHTWERKYTQSFVGEPEGKKPRCKKEDNVKMDLREIGHCGVDWIHQAHDGEQWQGRSACEHDKETSCSIKCGESAP